MPPQLECTRPEGFAPPDGRSKNLLLQLGHRRSIDFDLLTINPLKNEQIRRIIRTNNKIEAMIVFERIIKMPGLLTLAAMKAFELGRRAKWKDYVDIYFISKEH